MLDGFANVTGMMSAEVVHDDELPGPKSRSEVVVDESEEHVSRRSSFDGHRGANPIEGDRAEHRQDATTIADDDVMSTLSDLRPCRRAGHRHVRSGLVEEDQSRRIQRLDFVQVRGAGLLDPFLSLLGVDEGLFLRDRFNRSRNARPTVAALTVVRVRAQ